MTKRKIQFRTQFSGKTFQSSGYKKKMGKSMTLPDQNLTIQELLERHSRGVPLGAVDKQGEYFDTEVPRFSDLTEMLEYKKELEEKRKELTKQINAEIEASKPQKPVVEDTEAEKGVQLPKGTDTEAKQTKSPKQ